MVATRRLDQLTNSVLRDLDLPGGELVVALSGGGDSAGLAYLVSRISDANKAIHIDHGLAGAARLRGAAVAIAASLDIKLDVVEVELGSGSSPEGQARAARYRAFSESAGRHGSLLTAHTKDDNAETVLMNVVRGSGLRGLAGIPPFRAPNILRPALGVARSDLREIARLAGLEFFDDPMNADLDLTRAFVRAKVMPLLGEMNPRIVDALSGVARSARCDVDFLDEMSQGVHLARHGDEAKVAIGDLMSQPRPVADRTIQSMLKGLLGNDGYNRQRSAAVMDIAEGRASSKQLGEGWSVWRAGPSLVVGRTDVGSQPSVVSLKPGVTTTGDRTFTVVESSGAARVVPLSRWAAIFPTDAELVATADGWVEANGERAWLPGERRRPVAWYRPGTLGYVSVYAAEGTEWTLSL